MGKAVPAQHPAVVLRSHYTLMRALLAIAMIAVVGLTAAVVIVANDNGVTDTTSAKPIESINYGGFNPATGRPETAPLPQRDAQAAPVAPGRVAPGQIYVNPSTGYPSAATAPSSPPSGIRHDGGPEEGTRGSGH